VVGATEVFLRFFFLRLSLSTLCSKDTALPPLTSLPNVAEIFA